MFDEETEGLLDSFITELMEAVRDGRLTFHEGCVVVTAPVGAPPEYITVMVDGINDSNVMWRGTPPAPGIGDVVIVWENTVSHRREIWSPGGAAGIAGMGVHDHSSAITGGQNLRQIQELEFDDATILTIDGAGSVTRTQVYHFVAANVGVVDDLDNVLGGVEGNELIIRPAAGHTITARHNQGGAGDFWFAGGADIVLDDQDHLRCIHDGTSWCDQSGGAGGALVVHDHHDAATGGQNLHEIQELEFDSPTLLTIAAGAITRTQVYHIIDTEGGIPLDILDTINGGADGEKLIIQIANNARNVLVDHGAVNIWLSCGADILLENAADKLHLIYDGTTGVWCSDKSGYGAAGGGTLDQAYDFGGAGAGRIITADAGQVEIGGTDGLRVAEGFTSIESTTVEPPFEVSYADVVNNATKFALRLKHLLTAGVGAIGMGVAHRFALVDGGGGEEDAASIDVVWEDATDGSEDSSLRILLMQGGAAIAECLRIQGPRIRFLETTDPANVANTGWLYVKDDGANRTELYYADEAGNVEKLTGMSHVRATTSAGQAILFNASTLVVFETEVYDTNAEFNPATGVFTAAQSGYYHIHSSVFFAAAAWGTGTTASMSALVNGALTALMDSTLAWAAVTTTLGLMGECTIYLTAADTLNIRLFQNAVNPSTPLLGVAIYNWLTIDRLI